MVTKLERELWDGEEIRYMERWFSSYTHPVFANDVCVCVCVPSTPMEVTTVSNSSCRSDLSISEGTRHTRVGKTLIYINKSNKLFFRQKTKGGTIRRESAKEDREGRGEESKQE